MCLIALALGRSPRFPVVLAANRDEFHQRPTEGLQRWLDDAGQPWMLAGRDAAAGGTWLGVNRCGRLATVTNIRRPGSQRADAPSRGGIVVARLGPRAAGEAALQQLAAGAYNPLNLLEVDLGAARAFWLSSDAPQPLELADGVHGLSNASLDTPWPKVQRLKAGLAAAVQHATAADDLIATLLAELADRHQPADAELPATGVPLDIERWLAPVFITTPDRHYGTRCSTVVVVERTSSGLRGHLRERSFDADGRPVADRHAHWQGGHHMPDEGSGMAGGRRTDGRAPGIDLSPVVTTTLNR